MFPREEGQKRGLVEKRRDIEVRRYVERPGDQNVIEVGTQSREIRMSGGKREVVTQSIRSQGFRQNRK